MLESAFAGTVVLTGSCKTLVLNNTLNFSLSNSGNDSAYSVIVNPYISGAQVVGNYSTNLLSPGSTFNFSIKLANVTAKGTYVDYIIVAYQQGTSFFSVFFPCWLEFGVPATSELFVATTPYYVNNSVELVNVTLMNGGEKSVDANVSLLLPPGVHAVGPSHYQLMLSPANTSHLQFKIDIKGLSGVSLTGAVYASYYLNNISFATRPDVFLIAPMPAKHYPISLLILYGAVAIIVIFGLFVFFIALRNRKRRQHKPQEGV
ncbi:MAG: CARDB domain-containing protein [Candidatus Micrarchaeia archaeon]